MRLRTHPARGRFRSRKREEQTKAPPEKISKTAPNPVKLMGMAQSLMQEQRFEEAVPLLHTVLADHPDLELALRSLGDCLIHLNLRDEALLLTQRAIDLNRSSENLVFHALMLLGWATDDYEPSEEVMAEVLSLAREAHHQSPDPKDFRFLDLSARLSLDLADIDGLATIVEEMIEKFPDKPQTQYYQGVLQEIDKELQQWRETNKETDDEVE